MSEYINNLTDAVAAMHKCRCSHFGTEHIKEEHEGKDVWEGDVEIFQLVSLKVIQKLMWLMDGAGWMTMTRSST